MLCESKNRRDPDYTNSCFHAGFFVLRGCPTYIVSQPRGLCPSVLWHRQNINVAFSNSVVMFVKSACLPCASRLLLCLAKCAAAQCCSSWFMPEPELILSRLRWNSLSPLLMDRKLSAGFQSTGIFMAPSANGMWQGWQASECGQLSREPNVTPYPVRSLFWLL